MSLAERASSLSEANRLSNSFGDTEQFDADLTRPCASRVASQAGHPREARVSTLGARKDHLRVGGRKGSRCWCGQQAYLNSLVAHKLQAGASVFSATPIPPKQRGGTNLERMQQHADLAWLFGGAAVPLTLLAQGAGATLANAGSIHDTQAPIGFSALLMWDEFLLSRAPQCPIRLKSKVLA